VSESQNEKQQSDTENVIPLATGVLWETAARNDTVGCIHKGVKEHANVSKAFR
jgi:hypothetical protein